MLVEANLVDMPLKFWDGELKILHHAGKNKIILFFLVLCFIFIFNIEQSDGKSSA